MIVRIFIASPSDVREERDAASHVIVRWNAAHSLAREVIVEPVRVETHGQYVQGDHPQNLINGQLLQRCDLLLAIFWSKLGTPTESDPSGTVQEIREFSAIHGHDRVMIFFSRRPLPPDVEAEQLTAVRKFKAEIQTQGFYGEFDSTTDFAEQFRQQLEIAMNDLRIALPQAVEHATPSPEADLLPAAMTLLAALSIDVGGRVLCSRTRSGHHISVGNREFSNAGDRRSESRWEAAVDQLEQLRFIKAVSYKREVFRITQKGFPISDQIWRVLILREIEKRQPSQYDYVDASDISSLTFAGTILSEQIVQKKLAEMANSKQIEILPSEGIAAAARMAHSGHRTLRDFAWLEFAEPDGG